MKWYGIAVVFFVSCVIVYFAQVSALDVRQFEHPAVTAVTSVEVPKTPLTAYDTGEKVDLPSGPYLLLFFSADCPYCKMVHLVLTENKSPVPVVAVLTHPDTKKKFAAWLEKGNPYSRIAADETGTWSRTFSVNGIPDLYLVKNNKSVARVPGAFTTEVWRDKIVPKLREVAYGGQK